MADNILSHIIQAYSFATWGAWSLMFWVGLDAITYALARGKGIFLVPTQHEAARASNAARLIISFGWKSFWDANVIRSWESSVLVSATQHKELSLRGHTRGCKVSRDMPMCTAKKTTSAISINAQYCTTESKYQHSTTHTHAHIGLGGRPWWCAHAADEIIQLSAQT